MGKLDGKMRFIAAGEESYGYMVGDFVRDKDAVSACAFFAAMAANATDEGKSMYDWLIDMYVDFGYYKENLLNITKKGQQGEQEIKAMMEKFRNNPPAEIIGSRVERLLDYKTLKEKNLISGKESALDFPHLMCFNSIWRMAPKSPFVHPAPNQKSSSISVYMQS